VWSGYGFNAALSFFIHQQGVSHEKYNCGEWELYSDTTASMQNRLRNEKGIKG